MARGYEQVYRRAGRRPKVVHRTPLGAGKTEFAVASRTAEPLTRRVP
jgi:hypothetical protein